MEQPWKWQVRWSNRPGLELGGVSIGATSSSSGAELERADKGHKSRHHQSWEQDRCSENQLKLGPRDVKCLVSGNRQDSAWVLREETLWWLRPGFPASHLHFLSGRNLVSVIYTVVGKWGKVLVPLQSFTFDYNTKCFGILIREYANIRKAGEANLLGLFEIIES